jgi:CheY-like chemotaxis protein
VVEDDPIVAVALRTILEGAGAGVFRATSAGDALRIINQMKLSAAVLDYGQGVNGGQATARRLTVLGIPFVFWSGRDLSRYAAWPNAPVVSKPAKGSEIVSTLHRLLHPDEPTVSVIAGLVA